MNVAFHIQDPTSPDTVYLFEAIIGALRGASLCMGMFAFASRAGVDSLIGDPEFQRFLRRSSMSLLVGIDAVTTRATLERIRELEQEHPRLTVRVFRNPTDALFHPKVARFEYPDGCQSLIAGSGNLTPGGLQQNFEAFSVVRAAANETLDLSSWDRFHTEHAADIRAIDEGALERAAKNVVHGPRLRDVPSVPGRSPAPSDEDRDVDVEPPVGHTDRFLVAQVPRAGGRWHQVHFNAEVIDQFFRVQYDTMQRAYLVECRRDGTFGEQEVRPCVYSESNRNLKIEFASRRGEPYPDGGSPIVVYRELQARSFAYMLLVPGDPGYVEMLRLTEALPNVGRGVRRVITDSARIHQAWPGCPLITALDAPGEWT